MIELANSHEEEVNKMLIKTSMDLKYKYYHYGFAKLKYEPKIETWEGIDFVSLDNGEV